MDDLKLFIL